MPPTNEGVRPRTDFRADVDFMARLVEDLPDLVLLHDWHGHLVYVNGAARQALGYVADEMYGMHASQLDRNPAKIRHVVAALRRNRQCLFTSVYTAKNGNGIRVEVASRVIAHQGQEVILSVARDITRRAEAQDRLKVKHRRLIAINNQLRLKSEKDPLTDLYNRLYFERILHRMEGNREYYPVSVFLLDVDGLKMVNDILGHSKGDLFLKKAVSLIKSNFRNEDIIARLGGDEFAVVMPRCPHQAAGEKALLLRRIADESLEEPLPVCFSVGFATTDNIFKSLYDVLREADADMYRDKAANRHRTSCRVGKSLWRLRSEGYHDF